MRTAPEAPRPVGRRLRLAVFCAALAAGLVVAGATVVSTSVRLHESAREPAAGWSWNATRPDASLLPTRQPSSVLDAFDRPQTDAERAVRRLVDAADASTVRILAGDDRMRVVAWLAPKDDVCAAVLTAADGLGEPVCDPVAQARTLGMTVATDGSGITSIQWGSSFDALRPGR